jgi:CDP-diacylglycerol--glycerol-3-phosphate 3-phosphatidyltransferase
MIPNYINQKEPLTHLRRRWWLATLLFFFTLWPVYVFLQNTWQPLYAQRWLIIAAVVLAYQLWLFRQGLKHNHRQGEAALLPTLGAGNALTLLRGLGLALLAGFLLSPRPPGAAAAG